MTKTKHQKLSKMGAKAIAKSIKNSTSQAMEGHTLEGLTEHNTDDLDLTGGTKPSHDANSTISKAMEDHEHAAKSFGELTIDDSHLTGGATPIQDALPTTPEAEVMKPPKKNFKKKNKRKKTLVSDMASSPSSDSTVIAAADSTTFSLTTRPHFGFNDHRDELKCRKHGCGKLTNCYDGSTVICPRCGVKSFLRYCSLKCLLDPDMRYHWAQECGQCPLKEDMPFRVDKSTLITRPSGLRPYVECPGRDNPARHRQAVFHSANGAAGDYFVFNDYSLIPIEDRGRVAVIGAGEIIAKVLIVPDHGYYEGQSIFHEVLEDCLRTGFSRPDKCLGLVDMVTKQLVASSQWNQEVQGCLIFQMRNEFAYEIPQEMLLRFSLVEPISA